MASWQAHTVAQFCKWIVKRPFVRAPTVETIRKVFNANRPAVPRGCTATTEVVGGVRGEWLVADGVTAIGTMLYVHGGAHIACSPVTHRAVTGWFARQGWRVFAPDYRLAPEHRFPSQIEDCIAVYRALLERTSPMQLVLAGDSAGGNLALALCLAIRNGGIAQPAAIALFSPVTDFTWSGESSITNSNRCAMFSKELLPYAAQFYLGDHDPRDPLASPYFGDLRGLPPMLFHVGADEILRDDSVRVAENAQEAGLDVELKVWPAVPHVWQLAHRWIPEGRESLAAAQAFLRRFIRSPA